MTKPLHYTSKFIAFMLVLLMGAAVIMTYLNQNSRAEQLAEPSTSFQNDIEQRRQINGVNVLYYHPELDDLEAYTRQFVNRMKRMGATDIAIAIPFFMSSNTDSTVATTAETPTVEEVDLLVREATAAGIRPTIKPLVDGVDEDFVRQAIEPEDIDTWFQTYYAVTKPYIELSERRALDSYVVGVELSSLQSYAFKWEGLIDKTRSVYSGGITYAMNWDATDIPFRDSLDFIGVDAYYPYDGELNNQQLKEFWHDTFDEHAFTEEPGFVVHEYGIPSEVGAETSPWTARGVNSVSESVQDTWLRAACDVIHQRSRGGYIWAVYFGTDLDQTRQDQKGYNILGKPSVESSIRDCFDWY